MFYVGVYLCISVCMSAANYMNVCFRGATRPTTCLQSGSDGAYGGPIPCHGQHVPSRLTRTVSGHSGHLPCSSHVQSCHIVVLLLVWLVAICPKIWYGFIIRLVIRLP